jgi:hypothetical protein
MDSVIDYAGLFPPAGLEMAEAIRNYANYRTGEWSWALGRFIVPISRLAEMQSCFGELPQNWHLSALGSADPESDLKPIADFNRRHPSFAIDSVELKTQSVEEIDHALQVFADRFRIFFEIPVADNARPLLAAIARGGGRAKVRTGGVKPEMFPPTAQLAGFILDCVKAQTPFKSTAGLHHALRSLHPLTYEPQSPSTMMYGFLNLLAASAFAYSGADAGTIEAILEENSIESFRFGEGGMIWRGRRLDNNLLREMRKSLLLSFGSCSFEEPICEMKALGAL